MSCKRCKELEKDLELYKIYYKAAKEAIVSLDKKIKDMRRMAGEVVDGI